MAPGARQANPSVAVAYFVTCTVLLLSLLEPDGCSGFVLQSSLRPTPLNNQAQQSQPHVAGTSSALRRPRAARLPFFGTTERERLVRLAAEPEEAVAEKDSIGEEPSIPNGEEGEVLAEGGDVLVPESEVDSPEDTAGEGEAEVPPVAEAVKGEGDGEEEVEEKEEEDPMTEIKEGIKELEKELQDEENKLADIRDSAQEKGQMGFLRIAAQVDNFRKTSGKGSGEYEADAKADVLRTMLPFFTPFEESEEKLNLETENEIKFNRNYQALYKQLKDVYAKIGASDFYGVVGEKFEWRRHEKVSEEHNEVMPAGNILECLSPGLELKTNVIRMAACVVSLGPEKTEPPPGEDAAAAEEEKAVEASEEGLRDAGAGEEDSAEEEGEAPKEAEDGEEQAA